MGRNMRVILLAAFPPELEGLEGAFPSDVVGVGMVQSALGAARAAQALGSAAAAGEPLGVLVGTCGAYASSGLAVGEVVEATAHVLADGTALEGRSALVGPLSDRIEASATLGAGRPALVATTLGITTDDALADGLALRTGASVEHLEAYAVATAFAAAGVPLAVVLGVANAVGRTGRDEWQRNHRAAARAAVTAVRRALELRAAPPVAR
jgi:nucleoside phosphorylase